MSFQLSPVLDSNKVFLVKRCELEGRLDPNYYKPLYKNIKNKIRSANTTDFLCNVADVLSGSTPAKSDYAKNETQYPIIKVSSYQKDFIDLSKVAYTHKIKSSIANAVKGDVYILSSAHQASYVGRFIKYLNTKPKENTTFVGELLCVRGLKNNSKYLFSLLNTEIYKTLINREKRGQTSHIYPKDIKKIKIPIPPKNIQAEIVAKMDKAYQHKKDKEAQAQNLLNSIGTYLLGELGIDLPEQTDNILKARIFTKKFSELEGRFDAHFHKLEFKNIEEKINLYRFESPKLKELFEINRGGSPRPINDYFTEDKNGINWIKIGDTKGVKKYIRKTKQKIKPEGVQYSRMVFEGDFILSNSMSFGKPFIMKTTGCIHDGWLLFRPITDKASKDYLHIILGSKLIYKLFQKQTIGGVVENLNIDLVKDIRIPLPPIEKQTQIAEHISQIRTKAKQLQTEAKTGLEQAKQEIETMILGDKNG
ncbi:MAG: hypothetical protein HFP77_00265 [Methylococcales symbiont of Iophon sp. n. MRB-2018]|nr:MAG: hypothetical protein HFP77_00265 [Methylococcales symbiont of Iophon sp. n. MRB-2018]KAF3980606.1 MAG: hypothetical protein HFP76_01255 [Methylococcales symbiont of Iophon sp. n. MRB-2018]